MPRQLPAAARQFTGPKPELSALTVFAREAASAATVVVAAIGGTAGIGKSALAVRIAHQVAAVFPDGQLSADLRGFGSAGRPVGPEEAIRGFLDAFAVERTCIPADLAAQAGLYRSVLADKKVVLVLDNTRDEDQVRPLLPGSGGCLVIVTSRRRLTGLAAPDGASLLTLDVFTEDETREHLSRRIGPRRISAEPEAAAELIGLCARVPLALSIGAAGAVGRPHLPLASLAADLRVRDWHQRSSGCSGLAPGVSQFPAGITTGSRAVLRRDLGMAGGSGRRWSSRPVRASARAGEPENRSPLVVA